MYGIIQSINQSIARSCLRVLGNLGIKSKINYKKVLDKSINVWYNPDINKGEIHMDKKTSLENNLYKLLKNHPYNVVRAECDRIGRQLMELDKRMAKVEDK